ncbi:hypothetical protein SLEP1_g42946 [Rubroshorea leprosula]|uniref:Uncharacterized protein n=1 Tax=Rubroshorea leprosula TaxID=152421 RepID=A0AAV5LBE6_9ROSI|nr:hypothetical protein SLEP1_g42946 [Rubroshorea leprosula]
MDRFSIPLFEGRIFVICMKFGYYSVTRLELGFRLQSNFGEC